MANLKSDGKPKPQEVQPVKKSKDIKKIRQYLRGKNNKRDYAIWVCGTNFLLRATDLLKLRWNDVLEDENTFKTHLIIGEQKIDKTARGKINDDVKEALKLYKNNISDFNIENYIFTSRKGDSHITVRSLHKIIKTTLKELGIKGNFGTHTLRKTGAYKIYADNIKDNPAIISYIQKILNHSSKSVTLRYIGIEAEEIDDIFDNIKW
ncbi:tyrosine-type recombinase/integrase [Paramaledivibacter caminithermalis]|uniref:Phage integrase family protein n=1 Tax=Paramaledivibacter caminithermalis (strain DSM 15212 / CIP 107654 / DViRD3) TaxID=1121301 RepID=A0A1M6M9L5_PARC5|nr:tyrosine-type recombinase/integrase [Paramaledivibacter caminithermalis]SHJ80165.1 Phage integrase family protein [Paramaledivibacter caminithermalis DSM 15212]